MKPVHIHHGDSREVIKTLADNSIDAVVTDLALGTAAEHLVCADLLLAGYRAFLSDQNCPYDIAVDVGGRLVRVQVKATRGQRNVPKRKPVDGSRSTPWVPAYMWHVRRAGKGRKRLYLADDFDLLALVAMDIRRIAYLAPSHTKQTIHIRPPGAKGGKQFDDYSVDRALGELA